MTDARTTSRTGLPGDDQSSEKSLRELIARLSDGLLTANEAVRLNSLLKEDPIAQEIYLDHMLIDGLLELEFSPVIAAFSSSITESKPSASGNGYALRADRWWAPLSLRTPVLLGVMLLGAALAVGVLAGGRISLVAATPIRAESQRQSLALVDRSFESGTPPTGKAPVPSLWYGDVVEVVGPHSGITPLEGERMLRFVKSESEPNDACELYQMVDLRLMSEVIATGQVSVDASAFFNAIPRRVWEV
jgi:hypothetical protein